MTHSHPREKIGRNALCPCGSGKKYKHCCLQNQPATVEIEDTPWQRQRAASDSLTDAMMKFAKQRFREELFEAWMDFNQTPIPPQIDKHPAEHQVFMPYFLFDWDPDRPQPRRGQQPKPGVVARAYLQEKARRLSDLERLILEQSMSQPVSFYEIVRCESGRGMVLRDVLIGDETEVEEHSGSEHVRPGDMVYAQLCRLPDVTTLSRMAPIAIPPGRKAEVVALRAELRRKIARQNRELAAEDLIRYRDKIRTVYLNTRDALNTPPKLCNTDGEPILFHTLTFRIGSAQVAFDALAPLAWGQSKEELLDEAEIDQDGALRGIKFDWRTRGNAMHKTWDNTILGHIEISCRLLVVEVNSAKRAEKIRGEIEKRLGMFAKHQNTRTQTPEQMIEESKRKKAVGALSSGDEKANQAIDPEAMQELQETMQEEARAWIHRKIPILGGRTPMEAVADPDGREIVESLLLDWGRSNENATGPGAIRFDIDEIRRLLRL